MQTDPVNEGCAMMITEVVNQTMPLRTLIADDQPDVLEALSLLLKSEGYQTDVADSPTHVLDSLSTKSFDLVLIDLNYSRDTTSGQEGIELLRRIRALDENLPIVAMTAWGNVELAVEAMQQGASDFVLKPWENSRLLHILHTQIERSHKIREQQNLISEQQERKRALLAREFAEATEIQQDLLPSKMSEIDGLEIAAAWHPLRTVSGDLFDVIKFTDSQAAICMADASGKGVPAALLMANVQATIKAFASPVVAPEAVCHQINRVVCGNLGLGRFITFFYGRLDTEQKRLIYTNAGHNAPILVRRDGRVDRLEANDAVLGTFPDWHFGQSEIEVSSGDRLALFTDGLTESTNRQGEEFGEWRLIELIADNRQLSAAELQQMVMDSFAQFTENNFQDDVTLLIIAVE
jgi:sigma-B regulation protein RsbU (phosphoserine phosphatase)